MKNIILYLIAIILATQIQNLQAQNKELKFNFNEDGSHYLKATLLNQVWLRYTENNPGTLVDGYAENETFDIGLRRTRMQVYGQVSDKVFFYTQIGTNNLNYISARKQGLFFHDALGEIKVKDNYLSIGAGLSGWSGLSRYASPSVGSILTMDAPIYQQATNDASDQFLRKYSIYAKGKLGKLDYRLALSKPMTIANSTVQGTAISNNALFSPKPPKIQTQAYVMYQFRDQESNLIPYNVGSYLGKKSVLNLGAGFIFQDKAMWHAENAGLDTVYSPLALLAVDVFYDYPLNTEKQTALTAYASFSVNDYGKNYIRNVGVMNPANGVNANASLNGAGNAFPMLGTGNAAYAQIGYLFKKDLLGKMGTLQAFAASQYAHWDRLQSNMAMYELGFNWLIDGNRAKLSFNYQSRPIFKQNSSGDWIENSRKGMFVTQFQIAI